MQLNEVLGRVEGLNKRFIYYLESQGYIRPAKIRKQRISRRDYSPEDLTRIRDLWAYYRRGYSVQSAQQMVERATQLSVYVLLTVPEKRGAEVVTLLAANERVQEASVVYGESANAVVRLAVPDETEVYAVLNEVFDRAFVAGVPRILKVEQGFAREGAARQGQPESGRKRGLQAYLLIKVPAKHAGGVLEQLKGLPGVAEAAVIYGETDIVARVVAPDQDELDDLILNQIQGLPAVESTRTFIVVGRLHWRRDAGNLADNGGR